MKVEFIVRFAAPQSIVSIVTDAARIEVDIADIEACFNRRRELPAQQTEFFIAAFVIVAKRRVFAVPANTLRVTRYALGIFDGASELPARQICFISFVTNPGTIGAIRRDAQRSVVDCVYSFAVFYGACELPALQIKLVVCVTTPWAVCAVPLDAHWLCIYGGNILRSLYSRAELAALEH